jgi:hypothetical protein
MIARLMIKPIFVKVVSRKVSMMIINLMSSLEITDGDSYFADVEMDSL